jgi:hypothetical protein
VSNCRIRKEALGVPTLLVDDLISVQNLYKCSHSAEHGQDERELQEDVIVVNLESPTDEQATKGAYPRMSAFCHAVTSNMARLGFRVAGFFAMRFAVRPVVSFAKLSSDIVPIVVSFVEVQVLSFASSRLGTTVGFVDHSLLQEPTYRDY